MSFQADIPQFYCKMRAEYAYNLESHHGEFFDVLVFGVDSIAGRAVGFDVVTSAGVMFSRLPVSALVWRPDAPDLPLGDLQLWDCFSYDVDVHEFSALRNWPVSVLLKDRVWYPGRYMFTLSWLRSPLAEDAGDGGFKRGHVIKLDCGCFAVQPNNRLRWFEGSFITEPFPERPDFKTNSYNWTCEDGSAWRSEDSDRYFYSMEPNDDEPASEAGPAGGAVPADEDGRGDVHAEGQKPEGGDSFWTQTGYRGEWACPHGVGHGNHVHGCCGYGCCSRDDFPLREPAGRKRINKGLPKRAEKTRQV